MEEDDDDDGPWKLQLLNFNSHVLDGTIQINVQE